MATTSAISQEATANKSLRVNEIFLSIQGETIKTGLPTGFIRLTGCPLRCQYCDPAYAFHEGNRISLSEIMQTISGYGTAHVTVTGGEPLAQPACLDLLSLLCDEGYQVSLETSGAMELTGVDARVMKIVDMKTPGSGEQDKNRFENLAHLTKEDQLKFVLCDETDYLWARQLLQERQLDQYCEVLFSPSHTELQANVLADWLLQDKLPVRLQIQLHKYLWGDVAGK